MSGNSFVGSFLHPSSRVILSARGAAVETARCSTNLAYLTSARCRFFPVATLPIPHPKTNSSLRRSLEEEQSRSVRSAADYEARIAAYADEEKALLGDLEENERAAADLARERDESAKRAEVLRLKLEVLESKVRDRDAEEMSTNAHLQKMLADSRASFERETSAMESKLADTGTRIASLEEELDTKRKVAFAAERALEKTRSNLVDVRGRYDEEAATAQSLREELGDVTAKLANAEAIRFKTASQEQEGAAAAQTQIAALRSQADDLLARLTEANEKAAAGERKLGEYSSRVQSMEGTLLQSSTSGGGGGSNIGKERKEEKEVVTAVSKAEEATIRRGQHSQGGTNLGQGGVGSG